MNKPCRRVDDVCRCYDPPGWWHEREHELEDEVERLRRKQEFEFNLNEDLQQQINRLREYETAYETMKAHAVQLEAENERLRAENLKLRARIEEAWDEYPEEKE